MKNKTNNKKELKWIQFEDKIIEHNSFGKDKILSSEQQVCDFVNENNIEVISISCRWAYPTILFYKATKGEKKE